MNYVFEFFNTTIIRRMIIGIIMCVVVVFGMVRIVMGLFDPVHPSFGDADGEFVVIERGMGMRDITILLEQKGLIRSARAVQIYGLVTGKAHALQAGTYFLNPSLSSFEIIAMIHRGRVGRSIVIPEGATVKDIDSILSRAGIIASGELMNARPDFLYDEYPFLARRSSLEGYLFPDTYIFSRDEGVEGVLRTMLANFSRKASYEFPHMTYDTLILASIIEKEVRSIEDRMLVSGILIKRLHAERGLDVDATLVYMKCDKTFMTCANRAVGSLDKEVDSVYNTYRYRGLPPTPIGNPGKDAIYAALNPKESPYWYYLSAKNTGETVFSRTLDEHNSNRLQYL